MYLNRQTGVVLLPLLALTVTTGCSSLAIEHEDALASAEPLADHEILAGEVPDPSKVKTTLKVSGCGEFAYFPAATNRSFVVLTGTDGFFMGEGESICTLTLHYDFPAGWTFDTPRSIATGAVVLGRDANAALTLTSSIGHGTHRVTEYFGAFTDVNFELSDEASAGGGNVPCGATSADLQVQVTVKLSGTHEMDAVFVDGIHSAIDWRRCP